MKEKFLDREYKHLKKNVMIKNICQVELVTIFDTLQSPVEITLERALEYIGPDEMLEVTPDSIRMRKLKKKKVLKN